ncbi:TPA: LamG-like jellyroll fold domain-containing protein [Bacillus cereus]
MLGLNKQAVKKIKKNLLPPFEKWGQVNLTDFYADGYNTSFRAKAIYAGLRYNVPIKEVKGRYLSFSIGELSGVGKPICQFSYKPVGKDWVRHTIFDIKKSFHFQVPEDIESAVVSVQTDFIWEEGFYRFSDIQLEEGYRPTNFEEMMSENKKSRKGLYFNGSSDFVRTGLSNFFNAEKDFSMDVVFKPHATGRLSSMQENIVMGWNGFHNGIVYDEAKSQVRAQIHYVKDGTTRRIQAVADAPKESRVRATMTYNASNRELKMYVNGTLAETVKATSFPKSEWAFKTNYGNLLFGATEGKSWACRCVINRGRLWDRALTLEEVFNENPMGNLVLDYDFENQDTSSNTVKDSTGRYNGVIVGAKYLQKNAIKSNIGKNLVPPLSEWTYTGDAYYRDGIAVLPSYSAKVESPLIPVDGIVSARLNAEYFSVKGSPVSLETGNDGSKIVYLANSAYFDKDMNPVKNNNDYYSNGNARIVGMPNEWSKREESAWNLTLGSQVRYVRLSYTLSSRYTSDYISIRNVMLSEMSTDSKLFEPYKLSNKRAKRTLKSYKKYPFDFKREGSVVFEGNLLGMNQPRVTKNNEIIVEEGTTNLVDENVFSGTLGRWERVDSYPDGLPMENAKVWRRKTNNTYWGLFSEFSKDQKQFGRTYTISFWYYMENGYDGSTKSNILGRPTETGNEYTTLTTSLNNTFSTTEKGVWKYGEETIKVTTDAYSYNYIQGFTNGTVADGKHIYIAGLQIEEKRHATSRAIGTRASESLVIPLNKGILNPNDFTIKAKVFLKNQKPFSNTQTEIYLFSVNKDANNRFNFKIRLSDASVFFEYYAPAKGFASEAGAFKFDEWNDISFSFNKDKKIATVTVNGKVRKQEGFDLSPPEMSRIITFADYNGVNNAGNGMLKDFSIRDGKGNITYKI